MSDYIVKKDKIESMEGITKTHFLNPNAVRTNKSLGDLVGLTGIGFHIVEIEPTYESTQYHVHYFEDECVYVLSGSAEVTIGEEAFPVAEGDFIGYPAGGLPHTMVNTGDTTLRCIVVGQRLAHDEADYPRLNKRIFRNQGRPWQVVDIDTIDFPNAGKK
ncbi:cupin domain-containing protein [Enterovibrio makurazakiensis]|uniref:Cupin domain-containing protein n=1 Tax=Enterovibrio gelatinilyticus TaxID=2899819 RepID=A0ABT5R2N0_9GAMM|nr:cupin domain-containing protein [Enterovibrio sp. ZSDZ42]MDD1794006.1 cupin domain-containing protein [Enterovibrio sp. ZSDZ42]